MNKKPNSGSFKKGLIPWNKGRRTYLDLEKIRRQHWKEGNSLIDISKELGVNDRLLSLRLKEINIPVRKKKLSKQHKEKIRATLIRKGIQPKQRYSGPPTSGCFKKGSTPWNKGKTGLQKSSKRGKTFEELYGMDKSKKIRDKIRLNTLEQFKNGMPKETRVKIGLKSLGNKHGLGNKNSLGKKHSPETIEKIREIKKRYIMNHPEEKLRLRQLRAKQIFPKKDSSIEVKIQNFLKQLGIEFFTHQHINIKHSYQCDIFIPSLNLVIEADGDYWHKYPTGRDIDHIRTSELLKKGFKVLRLWEFEINDMTIEKFKEKLST